jgi:hypothetical protein
VRRIRAVAPLTPAQERTRERVETLIGLMAPALSLVLAAGDRISRMVAPEDHEYYPVRPMADGDEKGGEVLQPGSPAHCS